MKYWINGGTAALMALATWRLWMDPVLPAVLDAWRERALLTERDGRVRLTEAGFLLSDALFTELL